MSIRRLGFLFMAVLLSGIGGMALAQVPSSNTILVQSPVPEGEEARAGRSAVLRGAGRLLQPQGYSLSVVDSVETTAVPHLHLDVSGDDEERVDLRIELRRSPWPELGRQLRLPAFTFSGLSVPDAARVTAGLALYTAGRCDAARDALAGPWLAQADLERLQTICLILNRDYSAAASLHRSAVQISRRDAEIYDYLWALFNTGQIPAAMEMADHLVTSAVDKGESLVALTERARLYASIAQVARGIADITQAIEIANDPYRVNYTPLSPRDVAALYVERGQLYVQLNRPYEARDNYNQAKTIASNYGPAYFHRGVLYFQQGTDFAAIEDFEQYLELEPDGEFAAQARGYIRQIEARAS